MTTKEIVDQIVDEITQTFFFELEKTSAEEWKKVELKINIIISDALEGEYRAGYDEGFEDGQESEI